VNVEEIQRRVDSFPRRHYEFRLKGVTTPVFDTDWANRHEQRRRYFFEPRLDRCGGSLCGTRVSGLRRFSGGHEARIHLHELSQVQRPTAHILS
jgi:hypothetical protein